MLTEGAKAGVNLLQEPWKARFSDYGSWLYSSHHRNRTVSPDATWSSPVQLYSVHNATSL